MKLTVNHIAWPVLSGYALLAALYAVYMASLFHEQAHPAPDSLGPLWCGNTVTDPIMPILNWGTPVALAALASLFLRSPRNRGSIFRLTLASGLFLLPTIGLLVFLTWYCHGPLDGFRVSRLVWWVVGI